MPTGKYIRTKPSNFKGHKHSDLSKLKMRLSQLIRSKNSVNTWLGRKHTEETKLKISLAQIKHKGESTFDRRLHSVYGNSFGEAEYNELLSLQKGVCAICGKPETGKYKGKIKRLSIDHNHQTKKVRGLLCFSCNTMLGKMSDNEEGIMKFLNYVKADGHRPMVEGASSGLLINVNPQHAN